MAWDKRSQIFIKEKRETPTKRGGEKGVSEKKKPGSLQPSRFKLKKKTKTRGPQKNF